MTEDDLNTLAALHAAATAGPWFVHELKDEVCMSALGIATVPQPDPVMALLLDEWPEDEMVAACIVQYPPYVLPKDKKWQANAELIAAMRNALPELLGLAKKGLAAESA